MESTINAPVEAHSHEDTREALTAWYEDRLAEGNPPTRQEFVRANKEQPTPLDKTEAPKLWEELCSREERKKLYPSGSTAADLMSKVFAPVRWIVPSILPEGVTLLSGKAKMGKSWLALGWCIAVATGGAALGKRRVDQGDALYLALEDNERRLRTRLSKVLTGSTAPDNLHIHTQWPHFDEGGVEALGYWLEDHRDCRLVVIDTLKKVRPRGGGNRNIYDLDYEALEPLLPIAAEHGVSILVVHHNNKMTDPTDPFDAVSGSTGLTGGVDNVLILNRERGKADAFLYVDGRDIEDQGKLPLRWTPEVCTWTLQDGEPIRYEMGSERRSIYDALPEYGEEGIGPKAIADATGMKPENVRKLLTKMVEAQEPEAYSSGYGKYTKPLNPVHSIHSGHTGHTPVEDVPSVNGTSESGHPYEAQNPLIERSVNDVNGVTDDTEGDSNVVNITDAPCSRNVEEDKNALLY